MQEEPVDCFGLPVLEFESTRSGVRDYSYIYYLPEEQQGTLLEKLSPLERKECELAEEELYSDIALNNDLFMHFRFLHPTELVQNGREELMPIHEKILRLQAELRALREV